MVTSFYTGEEADSKKGSNSSLKTCATASSLLVHSLPTPRISVNLVSIFHYSEVCEKEPSLPHLMVDEI
jgi:hypothetical protein